MRSNVIPRILEQEDLQASDTDLPPFLHSELVRRLPTWLVECPSFTDCMVGHEQILQSPSVTLGGEVLAGPACLQQLEPWLVACCVRRRVRGTKAPDFFFLF